MLQGNVLRSGDSSLVNLQLVDATTGAQVWSDRNTLQDSDVFAQSSVRLRSIAHHMWTAVVSAETQHVLAKPVSALNASELVLHALATRERDESLAGVREARKQVDMALKLDPNCVPALIVQSRLSEAESILDPRADESRIAREMDGYTARAVALDPTNSSAWSSRAIALFYRGRFDAALEAIAAAIDLDAEDPELLNHRAGMLNFTGRPADALPLIERALAMDTSAENVGYASRQSCVSNLLLGQTAKAIAMCEKSAGLGRVNVTTTPWLVAAYAMNGEAGKAAAAKAELLGIAPHYTVAQAGADSPGTHPEFGRLEEKYFFAGLRKAGIPEK